MLLKPPSDLALLYNQLNKTSSEKNYDSENFINAKYFDNDQIQTSSFLTSTNLLIPY